MAQRRFRFVVPSPQKTKESLSFQDPRIAHTFSGGKVELDDSVQSNAPNSVSASRDSPGEDESRDVSPDRVSDISAATTSLLTENISPDGKSSARLRGLTDVNRKAASMSDGDNDGRQVARKAKRGVRLARVRKHINTAAPSVRKPLMSALLESMRTRLAMYDRGSWERQSFHSKRSNSVEAAAPRATKGKRKPDLMDLDLVRGSTFRKSTPLPFWTVFVDTVLFPVTMWRHVSSWYAIVFATTLYFAQIVSTVLFCNLEDDSPLTYTEVTLPWILFFGIGFVYSKAASTDFQEDESDNDSDSSDDDDDVDNNVRSTMDSMVRVRLFDNKYETGYFKTEMTIGDISHHLSAVEQSAPEVTFYSTLGLIGALMVASVPIISRVFQYVYTAMPAELMAGDVGAFLLQVASMDVSYERLRHVAHLSLGAGSTDSMFISLSCWCTNLVLSGIAFFALSTAESVYWRRCLNATYFVAMTSASRARRLQIPHFRLHKIQNIKLWFSLRSFIKKKGPQRSVDIIVSSSFAAFVVVFALLYFEIVASNNNFLLTTLALETTTFSVVLSLYLLRIMTLGAKVAKKYKNPTALLVEQMNLYVRMEANPLKKDEFALCQNLLKLAVKLVKELEGSKAKKSAVVMSPLLYSVTKLVIIGALSAGISRFFGFTVPLKKLISTSLFV